MLHINPFVRSKGHFFKIGLTALCNEVCLKNAYWMFYLPKCLLRTNGYFIFGFGLSAELSGWQTKNDVLHRLTTIFPPNNTTWAGKSTFLGAWTTVVDLPMVPKCGGEIQYSLIVVVRTSSRSEGLDSTAGAASRRSASGFSAFSAGQRSLD